MTKKTLWTGFVAFAIALAVGFNPALATPVGQVKGDTLNISGNAWLGSGLYRSTFTAASGNLALAGSLTAASIAAPLAGAVTATTLTTSGNVVMASGGVYASTFTASTGAMVFPGAVTATGGFVGTLTGGASLSMPLAGGTFTGLIKHYHRTKAQINALTPAVGDTYTCSDCVNTFTLCVGTGTAVGQFREVGTATGCY